MRRTAHGTACHSINIDEELPWCSIHNVQYRRNNFCLHVVVSCIYFTQSRLPLTLQVKARRASKSATSDWMELEKQRGISITSTALTFEYDGNQVGTRLRAIV